MLGLQFQCALSAPHLLLQLSKPTTIYKYLHTYYRTFLVKTYANQCTSHLFFMNYISRSSSYILFFFSLFSLSYSTTKKRRENYMHRCLFRTSGLYHITWLNQLQQSYVYDRWSTVLTAAIYMVYPTHVITYNKVIYIYNIFLLTTHIYNIYGY